jgi:hypothetical protein
LNTERSSLFTDGLAELQLQATKEKKETASLASSTFGRKSKTDKVNVIVIILFYAIDDVDDDDDDDVVDDYIAVSIPIKLLSSSLLSISHITFLLLFHRRRSLHHHYKD